MGSPSINLKEAGESIDFLHTSSREHSCHFSCSKESHQDKRPGHSRTTSLLSLSVPSTASPLCHSQDKFSSFIYLHLLRLCAKNSKPRLLSHSVKAYKKILGCCHTIHSVLRFLGHRVLCEQWQQEESGMSDRVQWPSHLQQLVRFLAPLPFLPALICEPGIWPALWNPLFISNYSKSPQLTNSQIILS